MTIICAYRAPCGETWIGSDSHVNGGDFIYPEHIEKLLRLGPWVLGVAGSAYSCALIPRKGREIAELDDPQDIADLLQGFWKEADYKKADYEGPPHYDQETVLASPRGVWSISGGGIVGVPKWGFVAGGSGMRAAYGAAWVAHRELDNAEAVVHYAIEAAIAFTTTCGGEPVLMRVAP